MLCSKDIVRDFKARLDFSYHNARLWILIFASLPKQFIHQKSELFFSSACQMAREMQISQTSCMAIWIIPNINSLKNSVFQFFRENPLCDWTQNFCRCWQCAAVDGRKCPDDATLGQDHFFLSFVQLYDRTTVLNTKFRPSVDLSSNDSNLVIGKKDLRKVRTSLYYCTIVRHSSGYTVL